MLEPPKPPPPQAVLHLPPATKEYSALAVLPHPLPNIEQVPVPATITPPPPPPDVTHILPLQSKASVHPPQPTKSPTTKLLDIKVQG